MATGSASEELLKHASEDPEHTVDHSLPKGVAAPAQEPDESLSSGLFAKGGMCVTTLLLASSGMGSGMIALPYAVKKAESPFIALAMLVVGYLLSIASTAVLLLGSSRLKTDTYGLVINAALKSEVTISGIPLIDALFFIYLFSCNLSFLVFIGDFIPSLARSIGIGLDVRPIAILMAAMLVIGPLSTFNEMSIVRYLAGGGVLAVGFTTAVVIVKSIHLMPDQADSIDHAWGAKPEFSWSSLGSAGIFVFAFCIGGNVPSIAVEMKDVTPTRAIVAAVVSNSIMLCVYSAIGFCGFFSFIDDPNFNSDFIKNYDDKDPWLIATRALLSITILSVAVLNFVPTLKCLYAVLQPTRFSKLEQSFKARAIITMVLSGVCAGTAIAVTSIGPLLDWMGVIFGAPELLVAPMVLVAGRGAGGEVAGLSRLQSKLVMVVVAVLLVFLWIASVASELD